MDEIKKYLPEHKFLILLNQFILRYDESECNKNKIVEHAYLFCVGYFLKYHQDSIYTGLKGSNNIIAFLTSALFGPDFYKFPDGNSVDRVLYFYKFIVEYVIWNEFEAERIFMNQFIYNDTSNNLNGKIKKGAKV
ncbi:hypothetical protein [Erwinia sp. ErVv1]|uniref:hypothetical protein n=1 Tax=Erwinia sp. ErVv1 TaxID=1603299 RepID=UPI00082FC64A|nr:hypothetical protein [Erwinia sp. ErVv1]